MFWNPTFFGTLHFSRTKFFPDLTFFRIQNFSGLKFSRLEIFWTDIIRTHNIFGIKIVWNQNFGPKYFQTQKYYVSKNIFRHWVSWKTKIQIKDDLKNQKPIEVHSSSSLQTSTKPSIQCQSNTWKTACSFTNFLNNSHKHSWDSQGMEQYNLK